MALHFFKRTAMFIAIISLFSLFLCFSSGFSIFPNSFYLYFNTCLFSFLTRTFERKYMFLVCNGILAFVAKSSISSTSSTSLSGDLLGELSICNIKPVVVAEIVPNDDTALKAEEEEEEEEEKGDEKEEVMEEESEVLLEEDERKEEENGALGREERENDEGEGNGDLTNTEELNRRIEEFIKKMKEEIRIEAQRQLIAV